jgi:alkanesulfonate monooxygenase SsuD/methylene tetrahydromethanopterin reductase-like flavin-dependent oxidoreductase (luciferase family)
MKFGISPSPFVWWKNVKMFENWIFEVENCGYNAIFIPDHYNLPVSDYSSNDLLDAWSTLSYVAAKTERINIGACVTPIARWLPSQLAKVIANVDILSEGRVLAGFGLGWFPDEFVNYSPQGTFDKPNVLSQRFLEGLNIIIKLWTEDKVTFNGKYYNLKDAELLPKPKQKPHPPLWSGGLGPYMLKLAAKYFNAWIAPRNGRKVLTPEEYKTKVEAIKFYLKKFGKSVDNFTFAVLMPNSGNIIDEAKFIEKYMQAGCQYYVVEIAPNVQYSERIEMVRRFAKEIIPSF